MSHEFEIGAKLRTEPIFARAGVVRTDCDEGDCVENAVLPAKVTEQPLADKTPAQWAYERLIMYIQKFEEGLDSNHEVGMGLVASDAGMLHIQGLGFYDPDIITFYGADQTGSKTQLIQHVSQLNVMLKAARKLEDEPTRIGFELKTRLEEGT